jgi:hypothetical protein
LQQFGIVASGLQQAFQNTAIHHVQASALNRFAHSVKRNICGSFSSFHGSFSLCYRFCGSICSGLCFGSAFFNSGFGCGLGSGGFCFGSCGLCFGSGLSGGGSFSFSFSFGSGSGSGSFCLSSGSFGSRFSFACLVNSLFDNFCHRLYHFGGLTRLNAEPNADSRNCSRDKYKQGLVHVFILLNGNFMNARYDRILGKSKVNFAAPAKTTALSCACHLGA